LGEISRDVDYYVLLSTHEQNGKGGRGSGQKSQFAITLEVLSAIPPMIYAGESQEKDIWSGEREQKIVVAVQFVRAVNLSLIVRMAKGPVPVSVE